MAGQLKGITIQIGGDTTKLSKALGDVNSKTKTLQSELKGVNSLLRLDSGNVTLLKQKQDLLTKSIGQTKEKLDTLKTAMKQIDSGETKATEEQYRDLQREIVNTEQKLKGLVEEQKNFGSVGYQKVAAFGEKLKGVGSKVQDVGREFSKLSTVTGAVLTGSAKLASDFQDGVAKVGTVADTSKVSLEKLSKDMLQLSTDTGRSATEITEATYQAISASVDTASAVDFVGTATKLAKAGFLETSDAVDVLTTIINAYGLEAKDAQDVADKLIQTQNDGKTTVNELSSSMGKVIPIASAYNVNIDNLSAAYANLTKNGIATRESGTYLKSMLNELGKNGSEVSNVLKEKTGKSFGELMASGKSLGDVLGILMESVNNDTTAFANLWGSTEAGTGALTLASKGTKEFNDELAKMGNSTGNTVKALETLDTPSAKAKKAFNALKNTGISLGETLLTSLGPLLKDLAEKLQGLAKWFGELDPHTQKVIIGILAIVTAIGPLLMGIGNMLVLVGNLVTLWPAIMNGLSAVGGAFGSLFSLLLTNPFVLIVGLIVGIGVAIYKLYQNCDGFRNAVDAVFKWISEIPAKIGKFFTEMGEKFTKWGADMLESGKKIGKTIIDALIFIFVELPIKFWTAIAGSILKFGQWGSKMLESGMNSAKRIVSSIIGILSKIPSNVWNAIKGAISNLGRWGSDMINIAGRKMREVANAIVGAVKSIPGKMLSIGRDIIHGIANGIGNAVDYLYGTIEDALGGLVDRAKEALGIFSPSRVMANQVGQYIPAGIGVGISDNIDDALDPMDALVGDLVGAGQNGLTLDRKLTATFDNQSPVGSITLSDVIKSIELACDKVVKACNKDLYIDKQTLIGETIDEIDAQLGHRYNLRTRGV
ncbi:phage tail tape measure protein [Peptostreptococcus sp. D1]|uniref:phage tail tape measure protein n=1 Tax=Peptostreptococcus sp. D1 TaxID=72304 RepID=UPI0008E99BD0|nr:phage tail tape measure protein [Peptostreptococcus sp. D1]SFE83954.1 phage tail tape measure protein, TP901 family, core region [Peptostreptococcus sp. D1]